MKPRHLQDDDSEDVTAEAGSTVRAKRRRLDPRLEAIAEAARTGAVSEEEAREQMLSALAGSKVLQAVPEAERIGILAALRMLTRDPAALEALRASEDE